MTLLADKLQAAQAAKTVALAAKTATEFLSEANESVIVPPVRKPKAKRGEHIKAIMAELKRAHPRRLTSKELAGILKLSHYDVSTHLSRLYLGGHPISRIDAAPGSGDRFEYGLKTKLPTKPKIDEAQLSLTLDDDDNDGYTSNISKFNEAQKPPHFYTKTTYHMEYRGVVLDLTLEQYEVMQNLK